MPVNESLAYEQFCRFQQCRDHGHLVFVEKANRCDAFFRGEQWELGDIAKLRSQRRPALTINKILSTLGTILGEQINNRSEVLFRPSSGADEDTADALTKVWMQIAQNNQLPWVRSDWFTDGLIRSRGFIDARLDFTDSMQGEVRIENLNSKNVVIDPDADEYDPDKWADVFVTKWMTPQDIAILYSEADADMLKDKDNSAFMYGYDSIERTRDRFGGTLANSNYYGGDETHGVRRNIRVLDRQSRRLDKQMHFVDLKTGDMRPIPRAWGREKIASILDKSQGALSTTKKLVKRVRWTVTADNVVLHDDWSPYSHFTVVPYFPYFHYGHTVGVVENLLDSQELLNKVSSQELHIVNTTANSGWMVESGSLVNMTVGELEQNGAATGLVVEYTKGSQPPEKITANATPQGLDRVSYKAEEHIKTISAVSDSMQGFDREDVAAKAIAYKQQRGSAGMSKVLDNLQRSDYLLARNVLNMVQEYYSEERLVTIVKGDSTHEVEQVAVNRFDETTGEIVNDLMLGEYEIVITSTPAYATLEDSQFQQALELRKVGVAIPDDIIIENSRLNRKADIIKRMSGNKDTPEAQAQAALQQRAQQATVAKVEAEATDKQAQAKLRTAQIDKVLAEAQATEAETGAGNGADPAMEQQNQEREFALQVDKHAHEKDLKEREFALKADAHEHQKQLAEQQMQHDADAQRSQAFLKSSQPTQGE